MSADNERRADRGATIIAAYTAIPGIGLNPAVPDDRAAAIVDCIVDLLHHVDTIGGDTSAVLDSATFHYYYESAVAAS